MSGQGAQNIFLVSAKESSCHAFFFSCVLKKGSAPKSGEFREFAFNVKRSSTLRNDWREHTAPSVNLESINRCSQCKHNLSLSPCPSKTWSFLSLPSMPSFNPIPGVCPVKIQSLICHFLPLNIFFPSSCGKPGEKNLYVLHFLSQLCMNNRKYFHLCFSLPLLLYYQAPLIWVFTGSVSPCSLGYCVYKSLMQGEWGHELVTSRLWFEV